MSGGIQYQDQKIYFPQPDARIPVNLRHGGVTWVIWGRRKEENANRLPKTDKFGNWLIKILV